MLVAVLNTPIARKGGTLTTDEKDHFTVWRLGKGAIFVHRKVTENAGEDCLIVQTYQLY